MSYRSKNSLGLGQPGYAAERYVPTNLGQANYAAERYLPVSLGQPGYAAERYLPVSLGQPGYAAERYVLGRAPYAEERYIPASLGQPGYAAERYVPMSGLGQPGYAAERYLPVSLGQPGYAAERYVPMSGLGQTKMGTTTTSKTGTTSGSTSTTKSGTTGEDTTARDFRTAADVGGSLIGGVVRGFTGGSTTTPATTPDTTATMTTEPAPSGGADWYWPVVISGGLILVGGIGYFALKGKKSAPTPNKRRKRVSRNAYGRSRYGSYSGDPRWMAAKYAGLDSEGKSFKKGDEILYWPSTKTVMTGAKAKQAWLDFLSAKGDEEGMPFARNGGDAWSDAAKRQRRHKKELVKLMPGAVVSAVHPSDLNIGALVWYQTNNGPVVAQIVGREQGEYGPREVLDLGKGRKVGTTLALDSHYLGAVGVARNGYSRRASRALKGKRRSRSKRVSRR